MNYRDRIQGIDLYSASKIANAAFQSLKWYLQERKDKKDMTQIARTQYASTVLKRTFVILGYITH